MHKKSILIIINDITASGGTERVATFLANNFSRTGIKVTILSLFHYGDSPYYELDKKVQLEVLEGNGFSDLAKFFKTNIFDAIIPISMGRLSFKVSIVHSLLRLKSQLVLSEHVGFETSSYLVRKLKLLSYNLADDLVLLTQHDYGVLKDKTSANVSVISNASSFQTMEGSSLPNKEKVVLAVGRLTYQKAFEKLIDIWATIENKQDWKLRIIGDGEDKEKLQSLIHHHGLSNSVELKPSSKNISEECEAASIITMTSRFEGLPLVLIESKSFGLAAISYNCKTGPKEIINHNEDGYVIDYNDHSSFKARLVELMGNSRKRKKMQLAAIECSRNYSIDSIFSQWQKILRK